MSEEHLKLKLAEIVQQFGPPAVFIHLHPHTIKYSSGSIQRNGVIRFDDSEKAIVKHVFLIAKHLKEPLNLAAQKGQAAFLTVARLDGQFGLGQDHIFSPISGGLFGLVKTLNLEWREVYCRGIDLSPALSPAQSVRRILDELHDPNHLIIEVGYRLPLPAEPGHPPAEVQASAQQTYAAQRLPQSSQEAERSTLVVSEQPALPPEEKVQS
jgi:hypothetical protein